MIHFCIAIITVLLMQTSVSFTTITSENCPAQYNISSANFTSQSSLNLISIMPKLYTGFTTDQSRVQSIVISANYTDLKIYLGQLMVPYLILMSIFLVLYLIAIVCCVFEKSCPPFKCMRRDYQNQPLQKIQLRTHMILGLVFALITLIVCIFALSTIPQLRYYMQYTKCSLFMGLDVALWGNNGWGGFAPLKSQINNIINNITASRDNINTTSQGDQWLIEGMQQLKKINLQLYKNHKDATLKTPNPTSSASAANAGSDEPTIQSLFIKYGLGPNGTFGTMVDDLDRGLRTIQTVKHVVIQLSQQGYNIKKSSIILLNSQQLIINNTKSSQNILQMYIEQLSALKVQLDTFSEEYFEEYFTIVISLMQGALGLLLVGAILQMLGISASYCFELSQCSIIAHSGWITMGIAYFGLIIIMFITLSLGSISYSFCHYYDKFLHNETEYRRVQAQYSQNIFTKMEVCVYSDGNSLTQFNIAEEMKTITNVFTDVATYYDLDNSNSVNYVNKDVLIGKFDSWINIIEKYRLGVFIDFDQTQRTEDNPNYMLQQLNLYTNQGAVLSTCSDDHWVYDVINCTNSNQSIYVVNPDGSNGIQLTNNGSILCISFNEKISLAQSQSWSMSDFIRRYLQIRSTCKQVYQKITQYGKTIINFRDSRYNLFQSIKDDLAIIRNINTEFNNNLTTYRFKIDNFYSSVSNLNDLITNQKSGLLISSNCITLGDNLKFTFNTFCINFMGQIVKLTIIILVLMAITLVTILTGSIYATVYMKIEKQDLLLAATAQIYEMENRTQQQIHRETNYDSSSSQSSQEGNSDNNNSNNPQ